MSTLQLGEGMLGASGPSFTEAEVFRGFFDVGQAASAGHRLDPPCSLLHIPMTLNLYCVLAQNMAEHIMM